MRIQMRVGLAVLTFAMLYPIFLSAVGTRIASVNDIALICFPIGLAGGLLWLGRQVQAPHILWQKRGISIVAMLVMLSILPTHWPLRLAFCLSKPMLSQLAADTLRTDLQNDDKGSRYQDGSLKPNPMLMAYPYHYSVVKRVGVFKLRSIDMTMNYNVAIPISTPAQFGCRSEFVYSPYAGHQPMMPVEENWMTYSGPMPDKINLGDSWWFVSY